MQDQLPCTDRLDIVEVAAAEVAVTAAVDSAVAWFPPPRLALARALDFTPPEVTATTFGGVSKRLRPCSLTRLSVRKGPGGSPMIVRMQVATPSNSLKRLLACFWHDEAGQDLVEYALIVLAMGLSTVAGVNGLAHSIINDVNLITNGFISAT